MLKEAKRLRRRVPEPPKSPKQAQFSVTSPGPRWTSDWGAMPGEPSHFLDIRKGDPETAKAAIVEREVTKPEGGYDKHFEVWGHWSDDAPIATFKTVGSAAKFAEGHFPLFHKTMAEYAATVGITDVFKTKLNESAGMNIGKTWIDVLEGKYGKKDVTSNAVHALIGEMPGLTIEGAKNIVKRMMQREEIIAIDPSQASEHTVAHEITHTLTGKALDFSKDQTRVAFNAVNELIDEVISTSPKESSKYLGHMEWISRPWEFTTEVVTHYLLGNLKPGSRLTKLAEAIIRNADDPGIQSMLGKSLSIYLAVKGFSSMMGDKKD